MGKMHYYDTVFTTLDPQLPPNEQSILDWLLHDHSYEDFILEGYSTTRTLGGVAETAAATPHEVPADRVGW